MGSLATPPIPPHFHEHSRLSPTRAMSAQSTTASRKRKASPNSEEDESMTTSPSIAPARLPISVPQSRKRVRTNLEGRPLNFERLLETLDRSELTKLLTDLTTSHPGLRDEVVSIAPRPSIQSTLQVLRTYYETLRSSFPLDPNPRSDYCFDRVRPQWQDVLNALADFTPHFLPPNEPQPATSLDYLDGVTDIIHELPEWDTPSHNLAKQNAYEEISRAWVAVIREASKRGGGFGLLYHGGWEAKVTQHNQKSGGLMQQVVEELHAALGWLQSGNTPGGGGSLGRGVQQRMDVRQQLFSGSYGVDQTPMKTGMW